MARASYPPRPNRGTAYDSTSTCWTPMLRVQMIISRAREEGRLTILQRALSPGVEVSRPGVEGVELLSRDRVVEACRGL